MEELKKPEFFYEEEIVILQNSFTLKNLIQILEEKSPDLSKDEILEKEFLIKDSALSLKVKTIKSDYGKQYEVYIKKINLYNAKLKVLK